MCDRDPCSANDGDLMIDPRDGPHTRRRLVDLVFRGRPTAARTLTTAQLRPPGCIRPGFEWLPEQPISAGRKRRVSLYCISCSDDRLDSHLCSLAASSTMKSAPRSEALYKALHGLRADGPTGFEGLIHSLIGRFTGRRLFLARSGSQRGRDASTARFGETYIDIECKRYALGHSPPARELTGGLMAAINASSGLLDLWIVASTTAIASTTADELLACAATSAVAIEILDWQASGLPQLAVLCAALSDATIEGLREREVSSSDLEAAAADLRQLRADPGFGAASADLNRRLASPDLGFNHALASANAWTVARLASRSKAQADFNQPLCVTDSAYQPYVDRYSVHAELDAWLVSCAKNPTVAAVLGHEGTGKTWATMKWWSSLVEKPLTLLSTSNREVSDDALSLIASQIFHQTGRLRNFEFWERSVRRWLQRPVGARPSILLVLDGLNERPRQEWDRLFASLGDEEWKGHLAIIATCRSEFWSERIAPRIRDLHDTVEIRVPPFDDDELARAWSDRRPSLTELPRRVRDFMRTPRIFRLASEHAVLLGQAGDLTVEQLLIDDWADRVRARQGFAHTANDFNNLLISVARSIKKGLSAFDREALRQHSSLARSSPDRNLDRDFDEIIAGQLFEQLDDVSSRYRVRPEYAGLAMGMLLATEVRDSYRDSGDSGVETVFANHLDPLQGLDEASAILRGAFAVACLQELYPARARLAIARRWLTLQNADDKHWRDFSAYLPRVPDLYFDLAENLWLDETIFSTREWAGDAILRWRNLSRVQEMIVNRCRSWLGLWHSDWYPFLGRADHVFLSRQRKHTKERRSLLTEQESSLLREATRANAPFIERLAFTLISHGARAPHTEGLLAWAVARALMQLPGELEALSWCLRLNNSDASDADVALLEGIDQLLEGSSETGTSAARTLLWASGTRTAASRLEQLPPLPSHPGWPRRQLIDVDPLDPDSGAPTDLAPATELLKAIEPSRLHSALGRTREDHDLELVEPILARFRPDLLGELYRQVLRSASTREEVPLRQLGWIVPESLLIIREREAATLDNARRSLFPKLAANPDDARATEAYLLLGILPLHPADKQIRLLLDRPKSAIDLRKLETVFTAVPEDRANELLTLNQTNEGYMVTRVLWFLGGTSFALSEASRSAFEFCFNHEDSSVRASAFRLAVRCNDVPVLASHKQSSWAADERDQSNEAHYGSLALIASATAGDYQALRHRVLFEYRGRLAHRDLTPEALGELGRELDALWTSLMGLSPSEQGAIRHSAIGRSNIDVASLRQLITSQPELAEKWVSATSDSSHVPWQAIDFYRSLCMALSDDPSRSAPLLTFLRSSQVFGGITYRPMSIDSCTWLAFHLATSDEVDSIRQSILEDAHTDELLYQLALAAQDQKAFDWLERVVRTDLEHSDLHRKARGLTLVGFLDEGSLLRALHPMLDGCGGYLEEVAAVARKRSASNQRARFWFRQSADRRDPVESWANFRLFLRCCDRRFFLWRESMIDANPDLPLLWRRHLEINDQQIDRAIKRNEGKLAEVLYGTRTSRYVWPWYRSPEPLETG